MTGALRTGGGVRVLLLCTANVCRSPLAEVLLRAELGPGTDVDVSSAGVRARPGDLACATMAEVAGVAPSGSPARQVDPRLLQQADLVLTMTRTHRAAAVDLAPAALRRTFTLREFADLAVLAAGGTDLPAAGSPGRRLADLVVAAPRARAGRVAGAHDDIPDPHGLGPAEHERAGAEIRRAVAVLGGLLRDRAASSAHAG
ncbi:low molecular weight phosphatase family protein [Blastococcus sp. TF02A-35]|uniref:arsenate reductase/protein-tyrosine-phosphatase family protein n=1 Tax=Blastococcus sp. TF02A-35 TaxID=2559612 RepID=UPI001073D80D|nr:low molecular weight phosphatase family protein [Blastococcus sp. TF02A_35]TFV52992.1 low molecular weight phosphatase family protein [Blastococcus sp. TF02A_35]